MVTESIGIGMLVYINIRQDLGQAKHKDTSNNRIQM